MSTVMRAHHFVAISGRVMDESSGLPIPGALAEIRSGPPEFERIRATAGMKAADARLDDRSKAAGDGIFYFLDLPDGTYHIRVSAAGGMSADVSVGVERSGRAVAPPSAVDVTLGTASPAGVAPAKPIKKQRPGSPRR
jgi:hypothetical protein